MGLVGLGLGFHGAVAHVLHAQGAGDHQDLVERVALAGFQNHAAHAGVQRQLGELAAHGRELVGLIDRAQLGEQLVTVGDGAFARRFNEGEVFHLPQVQALHAQDHARQGRAQDLRVGETRATGKVFIVVQANTNAVGDTAAAARALVRRGLADGLDHQLLDLAAQAVALHAGGARVDHVADSGHGERGFGHVGGQDDAPPAAGVEHAVLLGLRQAREQRQDLGVARPRLVGHVFAQVVGGFSDLALAGQKHQDVAARTTGPQLVHAVGNGRVQVVFARFFKRPVALLDRVGAPRHQDHRGLAFGAGEMLGEAVGVDGGRGDDDFQVGATRQDLPQVAQQEVDVEAALVRLVDDDRVVGLEQRVGLGFGQQDAVGHELDRGLCAQAVLEAHLVAHHLTQRGFELVGDALGHRTRGDAPRLGVADQARRFTRAGVRARQAAPHGQGDFGQLRGLARAGFTADDDDLVLGQGVHDVLTPTRDGQAVGKIQHIRGLGHGRRHGGDYPTPRIHVLHWFT